MCSNKASFTKIVSGPTFNLDVLQCTTKNCSMTGKMRIIAEGKKCVSNYEGLEPFT